MLNALYKDAANNGLILSDNQALVAKIDDVTGFLTTSVNLSRTGVQDYLGFELGLTERATEVIGVMRPADEVFHPDSIKSFVNLVVTDDHPTELVNINNVKVLQKGSVSHVEQANDVLKGVITITDKKQIAKIKDGKIEVSVGYAQKLKPEKGVFDGKEYEFVQTNIRANHLAIVDAGRCGAACKLITDHKTKEKDMVKTIIDGISYDVEDVQLAQAITKMQATHDEEKTALQKKLDEEEEAKKKAMAEKDKVEAQKDAMEKEKLTDDALAKLVSDKAALFAQVKTILGDKMPECSNCDAELKILVVEDVLPDMDLKDKSESYIDAAYDMAVQKFKKNNDSTKKLNDDFSNIKTSDLNTDRAKARADYAKDQLNLEGV